MQDHIPVPVSSLVFGAARCGSFRYCSPKNVSVFSVLVLHWLSACHCQGIWSWIQTGELCHPLCWQAGHWCCKQCCKRSLFLQQKNWVQMLIADAKIKRASIESRPTPTNSAVTSQGLHTTVLWQILQCQSKGHCAYYSDRFCSTNPRTLCILLWHNLQGRSQGHCAYYPDRFSRANPKDIVHTTLTNYPGPIPRTLCILLGQILQGQSQGHCAYYPDRFSRANPKDIVHTTLTDSAVLIPWTLCILFWQILQCWSQGHCAYILQFSNLQCQSRDHLYGLLTKCWTTHSIWKLIHGRQRCPKKTFFDLLMEETGYRFEKQQRNMEETWQRKPSMLDLMTMYQETDCM